MLFSIILMIIILSPIHSVYHVEIRLSSLGYQFQYRDSTQLILNLIAQNRIICSAACNQQALCHAFDYDSTSGRCRLFEGDLTTGSLVPSASPISLVGIVLITPSLFFPMHDRPCQACQENRYEYCPINMSTCQCRPHTFWNGSICSLQLFENDTCSQIDACREDLNLACNQNGNGTFLQCKAINSVHSKFIVTKYNPVQII